MQSILVTKQVCGYWQLFGNYVGYGKLPCIVLIYALYMVTKRSINPMRGIAVEELGNTRRMLVQYKKAIAGLPVGALIAKRIKGHIYYYLEYREGGRYRFKYMGKVLPSEVARYGENKRLRAKYRNLLASLRVQEKFLRKVLNERGK